MKKLRDWGSEALIVRSWGPGLLSRISCGGHWARRCSLRISIFSLLCLVGSGNGAAAARWAILVAGISGDADLQKEYLKEIRDLHATLEGRLGFARDHIVVLFDDPALDPALIRFQSTRDNLAKVCREMAAKVRKEDLVFVFITGHGSYDQNVYKLNLPGPDPTGDDLAAMLYLVAADRMVIVNATNASGGSLSALSQKGKIILTATKSGMERNQTHFAPFFIESLQNENGDADKNERVSILEAFAYTARKVEEYYSKEESLQTEHPMLDDDGDGQGHDKPGPDNGDGALARRTYLDAGPPLITKGKLSPEQLELAQEAQSLEKQIEELRGAKAGMGEDEYDKQLEALLLKLARINEKLRQK